MPSHPAISRSLQSLASSWDRRPPRERRTLVLGAAFLALILAWLVLIAPAQGARANLEKTVPVLREQVAALQTMAREAALVTAQAGNAAALEAQSQQSIEAGLSAQGLKPQSVVLSGDVVRVQLAAVSYTTLLEWVSSVQRSAAMSMVEASITALEQTDQVNATLTLRQPKSEGQ
ncbi:MAG: type II secretion system protein GspM [Janthinobacterium lividum]